MLKDVDYNKNVTKLIVFKKIKGTIHRIQIHNVLKSNIKNALVFIVKPQRRKKDLCICHNCVYPEIKMGVQQRT